MFGHDRTEVLIAGAGPTGLFTALMLAERGVSVEVIDEQPRPAGHSYALALHPATLQMLDDIGLTTDLLALGRRIDEIDLYDGAALRATVNLTALDTPFPFVLSLPQSELERLLIRRLVRKGIEVHWNHRLAEVDTFGTHVEATVQRLGLETRGYGVAHPEWVVEKIMTRRPQFLVGADGVRSVVRHVLGAPFEEVGKSQVFGVFEYDSDEDAGGALRLVLDDTSLNALWPLPDQRCRWSLELEDPEVTSGERVKSRRWSSDDPMFHYHLESDHIQNLIRSRAPWFAFDPEDVGWSAEIRFERRLAGSYGNGRVWLVGDSAHVTGPVGMQSMNIGFREAHDLAGRLARVLRHQDPTELLNDYATHQMHEWRFLLGQIGGLAPTMSTDPWIARNSDRLLSCVPASGPDLIAVADQLHLRVARA